MIEKKKSGGFGRRGIGARGYTGNIHKENVKGGDVGHVCLQRVQWGSFLLG